GIKAGSQGLITAWRMEKIGRSTEAAEQYEKYSIYFPRSSDVPFALYKAGSLRRNIGQILASNRLLNRLLKEYPKSEYGVRAEFLLAANVESLIRFEQAADL